MQTDTLYFIWGITLWSSVPNPCCSWSRLCRNVLLIATKWLGFLKHLRIVFCVTDRQTLHFNYTLTCSFSPPCQILVYYHYVNTATIVVTMSPFHSLLIYQFLFFLSLSLRAVVPLMAVRQNCANPFCKRIANRCSLSSQETVCISL